MHRLSFFHLLLGLLLAVASRPAQLEAQAAPRTTADGVYTTAQAKRGADVYAGLCQSCHTAASHTGVPFRNKWVGRPLSDLFAYITKEMPKTEPGSLTDEQYTLVLAYMLRMNGMPAGRSELAAKSSLLQAIRIDLPTEGASSVMQR